MLIEIKLGKSYKDKETGFYGRATAKAEYLYDSPMVLLSGIDTTGRPVDYWIAEERIEIIE